jgi:hypothetical protein
MPGRDVDSWHVMIDGCSALRLFEWMKECLAPTGHTYDQCACANSEAFLYFDAMSRDHGIQPGAEHYVGIIEVLGKSGHLNEALEPNAMVWESFVEPGAYEW